MKALISTVEPREAGYRVVQIAEDNATFETHESLVWVDCPNDLKADEKWYDPADNQFKNFPPPPPSPDVPAADNQPASSGTQQL